MYVRVHATPGARKECVTKVNETEFSIAVREPAERNMVRKCGALLQDLEQFCERCTAFVG